MSHGTISSTTTTGHLLEKHADHIILALPGTDYRLRLALPAGRADKLPAPKPEDQIGPQVSLDGIISAQARRIDIVEQGGRFIEPVNGRPRRVQGRVTEVDAAGNKVYVRCAPGCVIALTPLPIQKASQFTEGQLVSCDVQPGATFEPIHEGSGSH